MGMQSTYKQLREQARELRLQGKSYKEIANQLQVARSTCSVWCRDLPYPDFSERSWRTRQLVDPELGDPELEALAHLARRRGVPAPRMVVFPPHILETTRLARGDLAELPMARSDAARWLRCRGWSIPEISRVVGASTSAVSTWCVEGGELPRGQVRGGKAPGLRELRRQARLDGCREALGELDHRDLVIAGVVAYICEGSKNKPWNSGSLSFVNSDVRLIRLWLRFLELMGVTEDRIRFRLLIHESADVEAALASWARDVDAPRAQFQRPTLKKHNPSTVRLNVGDGYRGCLNVTVLKGSGLLELVEQSFEALSESMAKRGKVTGRPTTDR